MDASQHCPSRQEGHWCSITALDADPAWQHHSLCSLGEPDLSLQHAISPMSDRLNRDPKWKVWDVLHLDDQGATYSSCSCTIWLIFGPMLHPPMHKDSPLCMMLVTL